MFWPKTTWCRGLRSKVIVLVGTQAAKSRVSQIWESFKLQVLSTIFPLWLSPTLVNPVTQGGNTRMSILSQMHGYAQFLQCIINWNEFSPCNLILKRPSTKRVYRSLVHKLWLPITHYYWITWARNDKRCASFQSESLPNLLQTVWSFLSLQWNKFWLARSSVFFMTLLAFSREPHKQAQD